MIWTWI